MRAFCVTISVIGFLIFDSEFVPEKGITNMTLNFGPQHPAAHGVLRLVLELSGEVCNIFLAFQIQAVNF